MRCGPFRSELELDGGPGSVTIEGLSPATTYTATFGSGRRTYASIEFTTLASPPGEELFRFATVGDLHLGRSHFGMRHTIVETDADVLHPVRCAEAAVAELTEWGAERLVVKGDLVEASTPHCWALAADLMGKVEVPYTLIPGNHEMAHGSVSARSQAAMHGLQLVEEVEVVDVAGLRLILMDSAVDGIDMGRWHHLVDDATDAAAEAEGPALLIVHHQPQRTPVPVYFPAGISSVTAKRFLRNIAAANPAVMGTSGHTHRHRRHVFEGIPWTEVGSTKDYPGAWAGYAVHEGGIRQVVRRVARPDVLSWTDRTRSAAGGAWRFWSPGTIDDRCFTHEWPRR